uniref:Uncharacterized protein n=1 Tax=Rhizophora mucronata TaxID=61149 RepID=A0A2P2Q868_RHIMU
MGKVQMTTMPIRNEASTNKQDRSFS